MAKLTLSMIVKNEEKYLRDCLISVNDVADEIVIVDTGSIDNTIKIAEEFGAKIFNFEWVNDFSEARNFALQKSTGNWILYLDADERLDKDSVKEIEKIISKNGADAYYCIVKSYDTEGSRDNSMRYTRLFSNSPQIKFEGKVHEQIEPSLAKNKYRLINSNILIHHLGYNISIEEKQKKASRNIELLKEEYELKKTAYTAFQMGQSYSILNDNEKAKKYLKIASENSELERSLRAQCFTSLSLIAHDENMVTEAEHYISNSLKLNGSQPFANLLASKIALRNGNIQLAEDRCKRAFELNKNSVSIKNQSNINIIVDPEEVIYFGLAIALQNRNTGLIGLYQKELSDLYHRKECENGVLKLAVIQKLFVSEQFNLSEEKMIVEMANKYNVNLLLILLSLNPNKSQVLQIVNNLINKLPDIIEVPKLLAKLLEEFGKLDEAIQVLENLVDINQHDAAVLFYLIPLYLKKATPEKIKPVINNLEQKFGNIPEVIDRVKKLKSKLQLANIIQ